MTDVLSPAPRPGHTPTPWELDGFNLSRVIVIRDGPDAAGHHYQDGRHSVTVARFEQIEDARIARDRVNGWDALQARVAALEEGLRPFGEAADVIEEDAFPDEYPVHGARDGYGEHRYVLTAGDFRRARALLDTQSVEAQS